MPPSTPLIRFKLCGFLAGSLIVPLFVMDKRYPSSLILTVSLAGMTIAFAVLPSIIGSDTYPDAKFTWRLFGFVCAKVCVSMCFAGMQATIGAMAVDAAGVANIPVREFSCRLNFLFFGSPEGSRMSFRILACECDTVPGLVDDDCVCCGACHGVTALRFRRAAQIIMIYLYHSSAPGAALGPIAAWLITWSRRYLGQSFAQAFHLWFYMAAGMSGVSMFCAAVLWLLFMRNSSADRVVAEQEKARRASEQV